MKNTDQNVTLLHLINNTGQLHGSQDRLIAMNNINFKVKREFKKVYFAGGQTIASKIEDGYTSFTIDKLNAYGLVVLE